MTARCQCLETAAQRAIEMGSRRRNTCRRQSVGKEGSGGAMRFIVFFLNLRFIVVD